MAALVRSAAFIVAAKRTPLGAFGGKMKDLTATEMSVLTNKAALDASGVTADSVDSVIIGNVLHSSIDAPELARLNFLNEKCSFKITDNPLEDNIKSRAEASIKQLFDFLRTEQYCLIYAEFIDAGKYTKVKREYRTGKKCRNTKRHKVPALSGPGWNL